MRLEKLFYSDNQLLLFFASLAVFLLVFEFGYRLGKRTGATLMSPRRRGLPPSIRRCWGCWACCWPLALVWRCSRFDTRKRLVVDEANAIGTTYLRAQWLPEPRRTEISKLLRQYVDLRLPADFQTPYTEEIVQQMVAQSDQLQDQLWSHAVDIAKRDPASPIAALFIATLNETIDLQTKRLAAFNNHVPAIILLLLYLFAAFSILVAGYVSGFRSRQSLFVMITMIGLVTFFLFVIVDLDRPQLGFITVSQESLIGLQKKMHADLTPTSATKGQ
jgi:hypothetical protein